MSVAEKDHVAAIKDAVAFHGKPITIDGKVYKALINAGETAFEASEFGLDNRDEDITATLVWQGKDPDPKTPILYRGRKKQIESLTRPSENVLELSLTNR